MIDFHNTKAFEPFHTDTAAVTGKRLETGAATARDLSLTCKCCVLEGDPVDTGDRVLGSAVARNVSITILKKNWPDHLGPQVGDAFTIPRLGTVKVAKQPFVTDTEFTVECIFSR